VTLTSVRAEEARLHTTSGRIEGHGLRARKLRVDTVSGDVVFDELEPLEMELHTDSGDVDLSTELTGTRSASIRSDSGDVTLRIGRLVPFALEAETEKGSVKTRDLAVEVVEKDDGRRASIRRGRNGARLDVVTVSGKVALRSL